ncbi:MAG: hypothetical protein IT371_25310 [Deltaproteobacteria bacterium]|nr:hypothetical protein [Deltaproteobacteria bacterium]
MARAALADPQPLEILVDTDVHVASEVTPRRVVDALRRQLRQAESGRLLQHDGGERALLNLLQTRDGQHLMPQGMLPRVTETCRRHGVPYSVVDRRTMVACPAVRARQTLTEADQSALRRLLLHDSGVLVAPRSADRVTLAAELVARRQQRTLVLAEDARIRDLWAAELGARLQLGAPNLATLGEARPAARVVVGTYEAVARLSAADLRDGYGMVLFDALDVVDPVVLMRVVRAVGARYLLGLAGSSTRADGLHDSLYLSLGGVIHQIHVSTAGRSVPFNTRFQATSFAFPYEGREHYQALLAALAQDEERNRQISEDIARETGAGHPCLVLSERRDHLEQLANRVPPGVRVELLTSAMRPADRQRTIERFRRGEVQVLMATGQIAAESVRAPEARRLFLTFPFSYMRKLEQVLRCLLQPSPNKLDAVLYDYDDERIAPLHRGFEKRAQVVAQLRRADDQAQTKAAQLELGLEADKGKTK